MPRTERLVAVGLALASLIILALAGLVLSELDREASLNRDVIGQIELNDELEALRTDLNGLAHAARLAAITGSREAIDSIGRLSQSVDERLARVSEDRPSDEHASALASASQAARLIVLNSRSITQTRDAHGREAAESTAKEAERLASEASRTIDEALDTRAARINRRTVEQIRVGDTLRHYVVGSLAAAIGLLAVLFMLYRGAKRREREALRRIERLAHHDSLTGLPNRALLRDLVEREISRAQRSERGFALLLFDLDGFKSVNDNCGHAAGDEVLKAAAERSRACMRASDTVGRLGGDEFMAILPEASLEGAMGVGEKLRESLGQAYIGCRGVAPVTASVGISLFPDHGSDVEALLRAADAALYESKRAGKNRVSVARRS